VKVVNGKERRRPGKWLLDYRDGGGVRHVLTFRTKEEASVAGARLKAEASTPRHPAVDVNVTVAEYSARWLAQGKASGLKPRSIETYEMNLRVHLLPAFGERKIRTLHRNEVKQWAVSKIQGGTSRGLVRILVSVLRAMLGAAVDDDIIAANPAAGVSKKIKLAVPKDQEPEKVKAFTRDQLRAFEREAAREPRYRVLFLTLARTGVRLGECIGLKWEDLDFEKRQIAVVRTIGRGREGTPKGGRSRTVDMSAELAAALARHLTEQKKRTLRAGWGEVPEWVFTSREGTPLDAGKPRAAMRRVLKAAGLPMHLSPHSFRHTFASVLLARGESVQWVQEQLGHASINLTVGTYGKWIPKRPVRGGVNALDESPTGEKPVTGTPPGGGVVAEVAAVVDALPNASLSR